MSDTERGTMGTSSRRSVGSLLSSSGKMAIVGLLASAATIGFTLWIQFLVIRQSTIGEPLVRSSLQLKHHIDRTFVELRGWIAYGDEKAKQSRLKLWNEDIATTLAELTTAAQALHAESVLKDVRALENGMRRLRYLQWSVEDVARSPANEPARGLYESDLSGLARQARFHLRVATISRRNEPDVTDDAVALLATFVECERTLVELLHDGTTAQAAASRRCVQETAKEAAARLDQWRGKERYAGVEALVVGAEEVEAYARSAARVVDLRMSDNWNVSQMMYRTRLKPLQSDVTELAEKIARDQLEYVQGQGRGLARWSFVVLALALLLGGLSGAAIWVNYRLEARVERALQRAKSLGKYVIEERIGGGGMGEVFKARHALLRRPAAVKVLRSEQAFEDDAQHRFEQEVRLTSRLTHPNTIAIFDYGKTANGLFYYAMELLDGVPLNVMVRCAGPQPASRVVHILRQVSGSLSEAHAKGLLHRDIKPSNVMLNELGGILDWVKVLDFGLVTPMQDAVPTGGEQLIVGTPAYLAPEAIRADGRVGPRSDLYAVGAVGYFLLTGSGMFDGLELDELLDAQLHRRPQLPSVRLGAEVPEALELLIMACLAKDPAERPGSAKALEQMLGQLDVPVWSPREAEAWWDEYGEAVRAAAIDTVGLSPARPSLEVKNHLELSRSASA